MEDRKLKLLAQAAASPEKHSNAFAVFTRTYEGLQIGEYSDQVIDEIISDGIETIAERFKKTAADQLDKSGIVSPLLKQSILNGCDEVLEQFSKSIEDLIQSVEAYNKRIAFDKLTKTQMQVDGLYVAGCCERYIYETHKKLVIGIGGGLVTKCNKIIDVAHSIINITPSEDTYYIYAVWPRIGGKAEIKAFTEPKGNTDQAFYMLWKSGTFDEIKF